jgi:hypothetical protein
MISTIRLYRSRRMRTGPDLENLCLQHVSIRCTDFTEYQTYQDYFKSR